MSKNKDIRFFLKSELQTRVRHNPSYSLRAFAKSLGITPTYLSFIIKGKRTLSDSALLRIGQQLKVEEKKLEEFRQFGLSMKRRRREKRMKEKEV